MLITAPLSPISFNLIPDFLKEEFISLVQERYENFIDSPYNEEIIPKPLTIFLHDIDMYREVAPFYEMIETSVQWDLNEGNPTHYPCPSSQNWTKEHSDAAANIISDCWENIQKDVILDIETVLTSMQMSFETEHSRIKNYAIVEVW